MDIHEATDKVLLHLKDFVQNLPQEQKENPAWPQTQTQTQTPAHLMWMIDTLLENPSWPIDKKSRWLGFIQGVCCCHFGLDVNEERNFTRPLFHQAYKSAATIVPQTKNPPSFPPKKSMS